MTNTLAYARTAEVTQGEAPDIPYVGTDCADPNNTTGVVTNWVFVYAGEPIENVVQLLSGPGDSQWFFAFDNRCDNENHWPLGVERIDTFSTPARAIASTSRRTRKPNWLAGRPSASSWTAWIPARSTPCRNLTPFRCAQRPLSRGRGANASRMRLNQRTR